MLKVTVHCRALPCELMSVCLQQLCVSIQDSSSAPVFDVVDIYSYFDLLKVVMTAVEVCYCEVLYICGDFVFPIFAIC